MRTPLSTILVLSVLWSPAQALAQASGARLLDWQAPTGCPTGEDVLRQLSRRLGRTLDAIDTDVRASAKVRAQDAGHGLELVIRSPHGSATRSLQAADCEELASATALIMALTIDPDAVDAREAEAALKDGAPAGQQLREDGSAAAPTGPRANAMPRTDGAEDVGGEVVEDLDDGVDEDVDENVDGDVHEDAAPAAPAEPWRIGSVGRLGLLADVGALPSAGLGATLEGGVSVERFELLLRGLYLAPQEIDAVGRSGRVGSLRMAAAGPAVCVAALRARPRLLPCAQVLYGQVWGQGEGITDGRDGSARWLEAGASLRAELDLARWIGLGLELGVALPLIRTAFRVEGHGEVHAPAPLSARVGFGLVIRP